MGFFSKVWKGIKKTVKKVARGVKKVVKKVGKAFGKLGVVGQLGLMFLVPYAMNGLGTFWKGFGGFANKLATSGNVASSLFGKTLSAVHTAGSMVGKVYTGITDTISNAVDVVRGKATGGDLIDSVQSIFSGPVDEAKSLFTGEKFEAFKEQALLDKSNLVKETLANAKEIQIPTIKDTLKPKTFSDKVTASLDVSKLNVNNLDGFDVGEFSEQLTDAVNTNQAKKTLGQKIMDYGTQQVENVKTAIKEFDVGEEIVGGLKSGIKSRTASEIINAPDPVYNQTSINLPAFFGADTQNQSVFNDIDFTIQSTTGNSWATQNLQNYEYIRSGLLQDETSWYHSANHAKNIVYGSAPNRGGM